MDGLNYLPGSDYRRQMQGGETEMPGRTLKAPIGCNGVGVHSGLDVRVRLVPAAPGAGVVFRRTDLAIDIAASFDNVVDTRMCTVVGQGDARVGTVEHLMAALTACGVSDVLVEVDGPELPVLDGSAEPWLFLIDCAGTLAQGGPRRVVEVLRTVRVTDGDAYAELRPGPDGFQMRLSIDFAAEAIGRQSLSFTLEEAGFRRDLARARTFALRHEIDALREQGLARGGSLDNAVVVDGGAVLNESGLRMDAEFVRHKMLDAVGDLSLAGAPLQGRFVGHKSGHGLNNQVLRALFADSANWRWADAEALIAA